MSKLDYHRAKYETSATKLDQLPADTGAEAEVAFVGRSNVGKSSVINAVTNQRGLARTSKTPGRTQMINVFELDPIHRLIDLPGYGYAKVPQSVKACWNEYLADYLLKRQCLKGLILIMDIRHPFQESDQNIINFVEQRKLPIHVLLNKSDKLKSGKAKQSYQFCKNALQQLDFSSNLQLFSAMKKTGIEEVHQQLDKWLLEE